MAAGRPSSFEAPGVPLNVSLLAVVVLAVSAMVIASRARARRRAANLKVSGGRKSLVMNLFRRA